MFYNPIIELIERALAWAKNYGSKVYWGWVFLCGIGGIIYLELLQQYGFKETLLYLIILLGFWPGLVYPISVYENHWKEKREKSENPTDKPQ